MIPSRQLPVPTDPPPGSWATFKTRLENWIVSVAQSFTAQILQQVVVTPVTPTPVGLAWAGTIPYTIDVATDGSPRAQLVADGTVLFFNPGALGAGEWNIQTVTGTVLIVLGAPPTSRVWFAFLLAR